MMKISQVIETLKEKGYFSIKTQSNLTRDGVSMTPFGFLSIPVNKVKVVIGDTINRVVVFGCLMKASDKIVKGESMQFSMDSTGTIKATVIARENGDVVLNEGEDYAVRFSELNKQVNKLVVDLNALVTAYNAHTHPVPAAAALLPPPAPTPVTSVTPTTGAPSTVNISEAKVDDVRLP